MIEQSVEGLDPRLQKQIAAARDALGQGEANYTIAVCARILSQYPACLEVRELLRTVQNTLPESRPSVAARFIRWGRRGLLVFRGKRLQAKDPIRAMHLAERLIEAEPRQISGHLLLAKAATVAKLAQTAVFAWEKVCQINPGNSQNMLALGEAYFTAKRNAEAAQTASSILRLDPLHPQAQELLKRASVAESIRAGGWGRTDTTRTTVL